MIKTSRIARKNTFALAITASLSLLAANAVIAAPVAPSNPQATESRQPVSDTWITTKVKAKLAATDDVKSLDVSVDTVNGVVHLTGDVHSNTERDKALSAARSIEGVKDVDASGLKVSADPAEEGEQESADSDQPVNDTWITTKVKAELATTDGVDSMDISVHTVNGVVALSGMVKSDIERKKAVAAARSVKGVRKVDTSGLKSAE